MAEIFNFFLNNNLGFIPENFNNHNTILDKDGAMTILWLDGSRTHNSIRIDVGSNVVSKYVDTALLSTNRYADADSYDQVGPSIWLANMPKWNLTFDYAGMMGTSGLETIFLYRGVRNGENIDWEEVKEFFSPADCRDDIFSACCTNQVLTCYITTSNEYLVAGRMSQESLARYPLKTETTYWYTTLLSSFCDSDGEGGVLIGIADNTGLPAAEVLYAPFSHVDSAWGTGVELGLAAAMDTDDYIENLDIAYDELNENIGAIISIYDDSEDELFMYFSVSLDGGANWSSSLITQGGSNNFTATVSNTLVSHATIMAGAEGGFIIGYTNENSSGYARPYVHLCELNGSGDAYTMGTAKACGQALAKYSASTDMIGPVFFRQPAERQVNIDPIGLVYIGYQMDQGVEFSDSHQETSKSLSMAFERLDEVAFPAAAAATFTIDTAGAGEFVVPVKILGTSTEKQDYYTNGFTGDETDKYIDAFDLVGTSATIKEYVPKDDIYIGGRTAYETPVEYAVKVMFDPKSWSAPNAELGSSDFEEYINRDLRKIYLPPTFYMEVVENVSQSETKQYTIWTIEQDGYTYEIRQVIPRFVDGQIVYYEANCYNVGNYNVWGRGGGY